MPSYEILGNVYSEYTLEAIAMIYDERELEVRGIDYYDEYFPAFQHIVAVTREASDYIWQEEKGQKSWPPESIQEKIRQGMRLGFLWANSELES